ncbi:Uncharacterized protein Fot_03604 [Forsythia ovata]|uniref:LAGLIDADG homing endonuclease n=1 Tax=Forsythia ovata TaxID=205694 RepID=A0ABD1XB21_9LAMI
MSGTSALRYEINAVDVNDIVDFEKWFNIGFCKNNKKKKYNDNNKILNPTFNFGILEVADKTWFYDLRTPEQCLINTYAKYFAQQKLGDMLNTFKLDEAQLTLALQLFKHAKRKLDEEFDTNDERVLDRVR